MKKMIARITATMLGVSMTVMSVPAFADEIGTEEITEDVVLVKEEEAVLSLTCEDAVNLALENNTQLLANDAKITSASLSVEVAEEQTKEYKSLEKDLSKIPGVSMAINVSNGLEQAYLKHGYYLDAATVGYDLAVMEKEKTKSTIAYDVTQKYYNVKLMEELIEISETGLAIAKENAEIVKKNFELGYVSELEVKNVENSVKSAEFSLESNKRNLEIATESLKIALGIDTENIKLVLTDEIVLPALPENVDEKIENAMLSRYDVTALRKSNELQSRYFEITSAYMGKNTSAYNSAYSEYLLSEYTYQNSSKLIKLSLKNDYAAILTAKDNITTAENSLEIKQVEYDSAKIKYEMGMITNLELTSKMVELDSCKVQLENTRLTYLLAVLKFDYNTTIGI
ncbi:MAG: TolC family protein [Clostridia bacterium]|nr:TolC family protein [Clostridia bacterium]